MFEAFKNTLHTWNATKNERQKLQHSYIVLTCAIILVSGGVSLFDGNAAHNLVKLAVASLIAFAANAVVWALLKSSVIERLPSRPRRQK